MWVFKVNSGKLYHNGTFIAEGYSGAVGFKNNTANECVPFKGPLPRGSYKIGPPHYSVKTKAYTLSLIPDSSNSMCGRGAFKIHGDNRKHPGTGSDGCIVLSLSIRKQIWVSGDHDLMVE
ncbi:tlde1 domain-containing protein [Photorhabdus sp. P32]|uniref:tlde1 domain-containing protein n=1 Tax=Photorhabdus sp. P32 TaxID=3117549 RepID=UPI00311ACD4E